MRRQRCTSAGVYMEVLDKAIFGKFWIKLLRAKPDVLFRYCVMDSEGWSKHVVNDAYALKLFERRVDAHRFGQPWPPEDLASKPRFVDDDNGQTEKWVCE